ncbi:transposase [Streptomyces sp. NPDC048508]|uniref:transposase n=1 Tax=Streptomyces sp. NPDC048508 TaxID=3365561 RepID=UPI00371FE3DC
MQLSEGWLPLGKRIPANVAETSQSSDASKTIKGRKRHVATGALSLLLAVIVTAVSFQNSTRGKRLLDELATSHPSVTKVWIDCGYQNNFFHRGTARGMAVEVVKRSTAKGLQPHKSIG